MSVIFKSMCLNYNNNEMMKNGSFDKFDDIL